jgi:CubicO group peptidase (beta-lactamase class C family)
MKSTRHVVVAAWIGTIALCGACRSAESTDEASLRARAIIEEATNPDAPGCVVGAMLQDNWVFKEAFGLADIASRAPNSTDRVFGVASMTKQFTAASAAIAASQHYFSLDDDIRKYLPELPDYGRPITIKNLVYHTNGLRDDNTLVDLTGKPNLYDTQKSLITLFARQRSVSFPAGEQFRYGNTGYVLLAEIIERTTGQTLAEYAEKNIFRPLGMKHTFYVGARQTPGTLSIPYSNEEGQWKQTSQEQTKHRGAGGLMTTLDDYARWALNLVAEESKLPGGSSLTRMLRTSGKTNDGADVQYGFGLKLETFHGVPSISHSGSGGGYKTLGMIFPTRNLLVTGFCNNGEYADAMVMAVADSFLGTSGARAAKDSSLRAQLSREALIGVYRERSLRLPAVVTLLDGEIHIVYDTDRPRMYAAAGGSSLRSRDDALVEFVQGSDGRISQLKQMEGGIYGSGVFDRIVPVTPSSAELRDYAGDYYSAEVDATYRMAVIDGRLHSWIVSGEETSAIRGAQKTFECRYQPMIKDEFVCFQNRLTLRFNRSAGGAVEGFALTAQHGWVVDLVFTRADHANRRRGS